MNKKISFDQGVISLMITHNKVYIIPISIIFACVFVFYTIIYPQINDWLTIRDQETFHEAKVRILQKNINLINNLNLITLDSQIKSVSYALPIAGDYYGILQDVANASFETGTQIRDYSFSVGLLSEKPVVISGDTKIDVILFTKGEVPPLRDFIKKLYESVPLVVLSHIQYAGKTGRIDLSFLYNPLTIDKPPEDKPIDILSVEKLAAVDTINKWSAFRNTAIPLFLPVPADIPASSPAQLNPFPSPTLQPTTVPTETPLPTPTDTPFPTPTDTLIPTPTDTLTP